MAFVPENIVIVEVKTVSFSANNPGKPFEVYSSEDVKKYTYKYGYYRAIIGEQRLVSVNIRIDVTGQLRNRKNPVKLGHITTESTFYLKDFDEWVEREDGENGEGNWVISDLMKSILVGLAFSTTRGILICQAQNTLLQGVILPVVAPSNLVEIQEESDT